MRTREVLRWNQSVRDLLGLAALSIAGAALVALDAACDVLEQLIDSSSAGDVDFSDPGKMFDLRNRGGMP